MAQIAVIHDNFITKQFNGHADAIDFDTDTLKLALIDSTLAPNPSTHTYWSSLSANEVSGGNYTAGGTTITITLTQSGKNLSIGASDVSFAQSGTGFTNARYAVVYKDTGTSSTSPIICHYDYGADFGNTTKNLVHRFSTNGGYIIQVSSV